MKRVVALKPLRTRSQTDGLIKNQDCPKATASLALVETAELVKGGFT